MKTGFPIPQTVEENTKEDYLYQNSREHLKR